jgi:hypothetical protein
MNETITVNKAINIGIRYVNYPTWGLFIVGMLLPLYLMIENIIPVWSVFVGYLAGFSLPLLYWCFAVTKWKLWAFENVRNVHELKRRAIQEKIIREDNSFYERLEIRNFDENEKWKSLKNKFNIEDIFQDDSTIPYETKIYFSKKKNYVELVFFLISLFIPIMIFSGKSYIYGSIWLIGIIFLISKSVKNIANNSPQIIINNTGIQIDSSNFNEWKEIVDDQVIKVGKSSCLIYSHSKGSVKLNIDDFDISGRKLNKLLIIYKGRSEKNNYH